MISNYLRWWRRRPHPSTYWVISYYGERSFNHLKYNSDRSIWKSNKPRRAR